MAGISIKGNREKDAKKRKNGLIFLFLLLLLLMCPARIADAKEKTVLSTARLTITEGTTKTLKLKNNRKKVTWNVISGKKNIRLQNKSKSGVRIAAKKQGIAKVQAVIGKRKYICLITVKRKRVTELDIMVNGKKFRAELSDTVAAKALVKKLPITINMKELNGNEKYYYLKSELPAEENVSGQIQAGDIMLFGSDCLVLFYKSFQTSYSYTRIGKILNSDKLAEAVGSGNVDVTIQIR